MKCKWCFATLNSTQTAIYTLNNISNNELLNISFSFETFYNVLAWYHAQLTSANICNYNLYSEYYKTNNNGTNLVINVNGGSDTNTASWNLENYQF